MNSNVNGGDDYLRNKEEYEQFWSQRTRRYWTYATQTKLRRFRYLADRHGLRERQGQWVFDMGFGMGVMLLSFNRTSYLAGVELSAPAVAETRAIAEKAGYPPTDLRVYVPGMSYPAEWNGRFDVVVSSHVLEHLMDPANAIRELMGLLTPSGTGVLIVPINERPGDDLNHFQQFTADSFRRLAEEVGLEVVELESCDCLMQMVFPIARRRQRQPTWWLRVASVVLNAVLAPLPNGILRLADWFLVRIGWQPSQCFVVVRQRAKT